MFQFLEKLAVMEKLDLVQLNLEFYSIFQSWK